MIDLTSIEQAARRIGPYVQRTVALEYPLLSEGLGAEVFLKHENHQLIGSFKARGALNAMMSLPSLPTGVIAASSGNHGQGVAFAARELGVDAVIVVPQWANPVKVAAIRALGAEILFHGQEASDVKRHARVLARERGLVIVDDFCDPNVVAGAGTVGLELVQDVPDLDVLLVPLGGGALAAGCGVAVRSSAPGIEVVGVQSEACQATFRSWRSGTVVPSPCATIADGLAVDEPDQVIVDLLRQCLDDVVLVAEAELREAMRTLVLDAHTLVEPSGAAGVAALLQDRRRWRGKRVGVVITGGNAREQDLVAALGSASVDPST